MQCTGRFVDAGRNWQNGKMRLTFEINEDVTAQINEVADVEKLDIKAVKHREKRSLDANALLWKCLSDIAGALRTDKWDIYLQMLKRYGRYTHIIVKENAVDAVKAQWRECEVIGDMIVNGQRAVQMLCYFGSSSYSTAEFSRLLDGVISEMKEMGLEPPMSEDMRAALERWDKQWQNQ